MGKNTVGSCTSKNQGPFYAFWTVLVNLQTGYTVRLLLKSFPWITLSLWLFKGTVGLWDETESRENRTLLEIVNSSRCVWARCSSLPKAKQCAAWYYSQVLLVYPLFCVSLKSTASAFYLQPKFWLMLVVLSQKWDRLPSVQYANIHAEQRHCLYCIFVWIWVLGDNSTKLASRLAESQGLDTLTKTKKLLITFWLVHCVTHLY